MSDSLGLTRLRTLAENATEPPDDARLHAAIDFLNAAKPAVIQKLCYAFLTVGLALREANDANDDPYNGWPGPTVDEALALFDEWMES